MKSILDHYCTQVLFLREKGKEFAQKYPDIASKIDFNGNQSNDPQTERIIESFAFMVAGLDAKIENNAENLGYYLLAGLYPGITAVFPPCAVIQFDSTEVCVLPRHTQLQVPTDLNDNYIFRTVYPLATYPLQITGLSITDANELKIDLRTISVPIEQMQLESLTFYLNALLLDEAMALYSALFDGERHITLSFNTQKYELPSSSLILLGFDENETIFPVQKFVNYSFHLLREVLLFPQKFMFFCIVGINDLIRHYSLRNIDEFSIFISLNDKNIKIHQNTVQINSIPVANLFDYSTNSFRFDGTKSRYLLLSNNHPHLAIHSIKEMHLIDSHTKEDVLVPQYFSFDFNTINNATDTVYWFQPLDDDHSTYVSFVDTNMNPTAVYADVAYAKTLCINKINPRHVLSNRLVRADGATAPNVQGKLVLQPSIPFYLGHHRNDIWNLLTQLAFGQLSKVNTNQLLDKLQNISTIYAGLHQSLVQTTLSNILRIELTESNRRIVHNARNLFAKAYTYQVVCKTFKNQPYSFLFFKVLDRYLKNNRPINSYLDLKIVHSN